jgi:N-acetyl sugar amidotransferase
MDSSVPDIVFAPDGICNYCEEFLARTSHCLFRSVEETARGRDAFIAAVKASGKGRPYDCVVGVSGGVDSSWALVKAVECGLRPLAVHMDNGWNSELAQNNIHVLVQKLGIDLYTHVIDWPEYRALMQSFFDADVVDVELLYDNAMLAVNYLQAESHGIRYILSGVNSSTEGMRMPLGWNWFKRDRRNILGIARAHGIKGFRTFPSVGTLHYIRHEIIQRIRWVSFLDYFDYNKEEALTALETKYGYKRYPYKHYESVFTRFYQGYILPRKFGIDKRRLHLGTLVASKQLSRDEALSLIGSAPYPSEQALVDDITYFLKKMRWDRRQLDEYLQRPRRSHADYPSEWPMWKRLHKVYVQMGRGIRSFTDKKT